ncbi:31983_t:CDS:2, partial [Racocetra persica]
VSGRGSLSGDRAKSLSCFGSVIGKYALSSSFSSYGLSGSFGSSLKYVSGRLVKLNITLRELTIALVWNLCSI